MKISFSFLFTILILIFAIMFLGSCSRSTVVDPGTSGSQNTYIGKWYCEQAMMAVEIKPDGTFEYYGLVPDDFVYGEDATIGDYTVEGNKVSLVLDDLAMDLIYNTEMDILTIDGTTATFNRIEQLPAKLPTPTPEQFKGAWYCEDSLSVLVLNTDNTFDSYAIKAGYYSYTSTAKGAYEIKGSAVSTNFNGEAYIDLYYNPNKDNITTIYGQTFVRVEKLPEEHPL